MTKEELKYLNKLAEKFHTLTLDLSDLVSVLPPSKADKAYRILKKAVEEKLCVSITAFGKEIVYLPQPKTNRRRF